MNTFCFESPPVFNSNPNRLSPRPTRPRLLNIYDNSFQKTAYVRAKKQQQQQQQQLRIPCSNRSVNAASLSTEKKLRAHILFQTVHRVCQSPMQYSYIDHSGPLFSPLFTCLNCLAVVVVFFGMRHFHFCTLHAILMSRPIVHTLRRNIDNDRKKCLTLFKYSRDSHAQSKVTCGALWCLIADVINTFIN